MGTALYRQYRSTSFDEVIGQDHITSTLKNSLQKGSIAHAYLLTGPRGVGKTSIARILAFAVNDIPYDKKGTHLDIIEIDAASNRRIDEIRSLRERVHIAPTSAKYKVYIIDEVHMLTREAFNALLKTLEEPPEHVIFILATTEIHKLPDTIVSRCITFTFRPIDDKSIVNHLKHIAKQEKISISDDALSLLAIHGDGSFRDSISLLDQIKNMSDGKISKSDIETALGLAPEEQVEQIITSVANGEPAQLSEALQAAYHHGASETNIAKQVGEYIRMQLISGPSILDSESATTLLRELLETSGSVKPRAALELTLLSALFKQKPVAATQPATSAKPKQKATPAAIAKKEASTAPAPVSTVTTTVALDDSLWDAILNSLKKQNNTLYGIARMAKAELADDTLVLTFKFPFHVKQINQPKNKTLLTTIINELGHGHLAIDISLASAEEKKTSPSKSDPLTSITDIFGDGEVLES